MTKIRYVSKSSYGPRHVLINHACQLTHIWHSRWVEKSGRLTVDLESLHLEGIDEVLPEALELRRNISLISDIDGTPGESSGDGLIDVNHVCEVGPAGICNQY